MSKLIGINGNALAIHALPVLAQSACYRMQIMM